MRGAASYSIVWSQSVLLTMFTLVYGIYYDYMSYTMIYVWCKGKMSMSLYWSIIAWYIKECLESGLQSMPDRLSYWMSDKRKDYEAQLALCITIAKTKKENK